MAQPSVAREPSMEEILASIRRIIESNEPQDNPLQRSLPPVYAEEEFDEEEIGIVAEVAANDPGLPARQPYQPFSEPQPERSFSLADVAARVRAAADRPTDLRFEQPSAPVATPSAPAMDAAAREPAPEPVARELQRPAPEPVAQQARVIETPVAVARPSEPVQAEVPVRIDPPPQQQGLPAKVEAAAALISEEAGAQVARSFGELAAAFDGVQNRSLEDLAQDMLRPMLQEWLDDNLPTLVERLVREEIERVARGPRR